MLIQWNILITLLISFCVANGTAGGAGTPILQDNEIKYTYPNDMRSSISIVFHNREPLVHEEEWVIVACISTNDFPGCDFSTTVSSTLSKVSSALTQSIDAFQQIKANASIVHIICSPFITTETNKTFQSWIRPAALEKDNRARSKYLQNKLRTYSFEPLSSNLIAALLKYGYKVTGVGYNVEPGVILFLDADYFIQHLAGEHSFYAIGLDYL